MGTFFTNLQVHRGDCARRVMETRVLGALRSLFGNRYVECKKDELADRTLIVTSASDAEWVTVFDEATEDQDLARLHRTARRLSAATETRVAAILVHDNEIVRMAGFAFGQRAARFTRTHGRFQGDASRWAIWLQRSSVDATAIHRTWKESARNAVEKVESIGSLFGMNSALASCGYDYFIEEPLAMFRSLRLRDATRPPKRIGESKRRPAGPPKLEAVRVRQDSEPYGKNRVSIRFTVTVNASEAEGSTGLDIGLEGSAVRLFSLTGGSFMTKGGPDGGGLKTLAFRRAKRTQTLSASAKELPLEGSFSFLLWAVSRLGEGSLVVSLVPRANRNGGIRSSEIQVQTSG